MPVGSAVLPGYRLAITPQELDLAVTLDCGQCFRFRQTGENCFEGVACGRLLRLRQTPAEILFLGVSEAEFESVWRPYFDLDTDYAAIRALLCQDPVMARAVSFAPGIRILRQPSWEGLLSFILSQNNNIPRIKASIEAFCKRYGSPLEEGFYSFPSPECLRGLRKEDLAGLGFGYRDQYIIDCVSRFLQGGIPLEDIRTLPLEHAREILLQVKGVGVKVAECALLFGFHRLDAFPIDTWMKKGLSAYYPNGFPPAFASIRGIAQQYLFHYMRCCGEKVENAANA